MSAKRMLTAVARLAVTVALVAVVTAIDYRVLGVNSVTAGFSYLILVLILATQLRLQEAVTASLVSVAVYNYYFFPPIGTFNVADPQNWVALAAFLATAITASQLSSTARRRAEEAQAREQEWEHMYQFSRALLLGTEETSFARHVERQLVAAFQVGDAQLYRLPEKEHDEEESTSSFAGGALRTVAASGNAWSDEVQHVSVAPIRLGAETVGSIAVRGPKLPSRVALEATAQLIAIAIERGRMQEGKMRLEAAEENERLKSALLDALAHEFKTPLTSVKAATTTLLSADLDSADQRELISVIDEEADRLTRQVSDSIELARIGAAPLVPQMEACWVDDIVLPALGVFRSALEERMLTIDLGQNLPAIFVDRKLSELALRQLLSNAVKYSPAGTEISVSARQVSSVAISLNVRNAGEGIDSREQARVFEKFYRGAHVRDRVAGTGLGLTIARTIIEAQGGSITVDSELGRGAVFTMTFPVAS